MLFHIWISVNFGTPHPWQSGALSAAEISLLEEELCEMLAELRKQAVPLVDSFDIRDELLNSTLGAWDGRVYQRWVRLWVSLHVQVPVCFYLMDWYWKRQILWMVIYMLSLQTHLSFCDPWRLYEEALKSPLNKTDVPKAYYQHLQPLMKSNL